MVAEREVYLGGHFQLARAKISVSRKALTALHRRKSEEYINGFPNFTIPVAVEGQNPTQIHFVGLFSERKDAVPLILLHGWPGRSPSSSPSRCSTKTNLRKLSGISAYAIYPPKRLHPSKSPISRYCSISPRFCILGCPAAGPGF